MPRRHHPNRRAEALAFLRAGVTVPEVARECGLNDQTLYRWAKQAGVTLTHIRRRQTMHDVAGRLLRALRAAHEERKAMEVTR